MQKTRKSSHEKEGSCVYVVSFKCDQSSTLITTLLQISSCYVGLRYNGTRMYIFVVFYSINSKWRLQGIIHLIPTANALKCSLIIVGKAYTEGVHIKHSLE